MLEMAGNWESSKEGESRFQKASEESRHPRRTRTNARSTRSLLHMTRCEPMNAQGEEVMET